MKEQSNVNVGDMEGLSVKLRRGEIVLIGVLLASFGLSVGCYWKLSGDTTHYAQPPKPHKMQPIDTLHTSGALPEEEGQSLYGPSFWFTFGPSCVMLVVLIVYWVIPRVLKRAHDVRYKYYDRLLIWYLGTTLALQIHALLSNFGYEWPSTEGHWQIVMCLIMGIGLFLLGDTIQNARPRWLISRHGASVRKSPEIWDKTHRIGGKSLKVAGVLALPAMFFPFEECGGFLIVPPLGFGLFFMFLYPIVASRRLTRADKQKA